MMKISPGPLAPISLPKRKITPRSYSLRILMDAEARIMTKMIKKKIAGEIPAIRLSPFQIQQSCQFTTGNFMNILAPSPFLTSCETVTVEAKN
jgi:hypothetical protein